MIERRRRLTSVPFTGKAVASCIADENLVFTEQIRVCVAINDET